LTGRRFERSGTLVFLMKSKSQIMPDMVSTSAWILYAGSQIWKTISNAIAAVDRSDRSAKELRNRQLEAKDKSKLQ
jgi:hypothetical protein